MPLYSTEIGTVIHALLDGTEYSDNYQTAELEAEFSGEPGWPFLKGLLEPNGRLASEYFQNQVALYPKNEFTDDALMRLAEYAYVSGLYMKSGEYLRTMLRDFPDSEHHTRAVELFVKSLEISGNQDSAAHYLALYNPGNDAVTVPPIRTADNQTAVPEAVQPVKTDAQEPQKDREKWAVQMGIFSHRENAETMRNSLTIQGFQAYLAEIESGGKAMYAVRVGPYDYEQTARNMSRTLQSKLDLDSFVVKE